MNKYDKILSQLEKYIPHTSKWGDPKLAFQRASRLMEILGNPQNSYPVIHIAGTSGKGSTAHMASKILMAHGSRVGLGLSPHVTDIRERIQIDSKPISKGLFVKYFEIVIKAVSKLENTQYGAPTYFEIIIAMSYLLYKKEKMDVVVMETGLGGRYDATNCISANKICVITKIGFDHMEFLGNSLEKIATEKSKIIGYQNITITVKQENSAQKVIEHEASTQKSQLITVDPDISISKPLSTLDETTFDFKFNNLTIPKLRVSLGGKYQAENAALAIIASSYELNLLGKKLNVDLVRKSLNAEHIPGRMQIVVLNGRTIILDGAHNTPKMKALTDHLMHFDSKTKYDVILALKSGKDFENILPQLIRIARHITITDFKGQGQGLVIKATNPADIASELDKLHFTNYSVIYESSKALKSALSRGSNKILITGSFYLISEIYSLLPVTSKRHKAS